MILLKEINTSFIVSVSSIIFNIGLSLLFLLIIVLIEQIRECKFKKQVFQCIL